MPREEFSKEEIDALFSVEKNAQKEKETGGETEDKKEVIRLSVLEALSTYRESIDAGEKPDTAKSKGVQKINELNQGEYDDLILPAIEQFYQQLENESSAPPPEELPIENIGQTKEETPRAKSMEEIREDVMRLNEMVQETEDLAKSRVQFALDNLIILIDEAEQAGFDVIKYRNIIANVFPRDHMRDVEGYLSGPNKPILMNADNFEEYEAKYKKIVDSALKFIETTKNELQSETEQKRTPQENPAENKPEATPEENREKLNQAVDRAIEVFNMEIRLLGSSTEKARGEAIKEFTRLTSEITNTGDENVEASNRLQARLEELIMQEQDKDDDEYLETFFGNKPTTESAPVTEPSARETPEILKTESEQPQREEQVEETARKSETPEEPTLEDAEKKAREIAEALGLAPREVQAVVAAETKEDVEKLPEETREKLGLGFGNIGFFIEQNKNKFFASVIERVAEKVDGKGTIGRFISSLAENYRHDEERAKQKFEDVKQGDKHRLSNAGYIVGNIVRYGRTALDFTGYTIASPFRYAMMAGMMFSRGSEAAKEARLKNEEVIEKTRVTDINKAEEQAWKIYEEAQKKAGDEEVSKEDLNRAFVENLPADILNRLNSEDLTVKTGTAKRIVDGISRRWIESSIDRLQNKLDKAETEEKRQIILSKYKAKLNDFNRIVGEYGSLDTLAISARLAEKASKGLVTAVSLETLVALPLEKLFDVKIWDSLSSALGIELHSDIPQQELKNTEYILGIDSSNGIDKREAEIIGEFISETYVNGDHDLAASYMDHYRDVKISGTSKSMEDYLSEWIKNRREDIASDVQAVKDLASEQKRVAGEIYAKGVLGIDISDGISPEEAQKIADEIHAKELSGEENTVRSLKSTFGNMQDSQGRRIIDIANSSEAPKGNAAENIPAGGTKPEGMQHRENFENIGPVGRKEFSNLILGEKDSVWQSTEDTFRLYRNQLGYNPAKDGDISAWARTKTAEIMHELSEKEYHGKGVPDVVHDNDKIVVYIGEDGKPHLRFENTSGIKSGYLEQEAVPKPNVENKPETPATPEPTKPDVVQEPETQPATPEPTKPATPEINNYEPGPNSVPQPEQTAPEDQRVEKVMKAVLEQNNRQIREMQVELEAELKAHPIDWASKPKSFTMTDSAGHTFWVEIRPDASMSSANESAMMPKVPGKIMDQVLERRVPTPNGKFMEVRIFGEIKTEVVPPHYEVSSRVVEPNNYEPAPAPEIHNYEPAPTPEINNYEPGQNSVPQPEQTAPTPEKPTIVPGPETNPAMPEPEHPTFGTKPPEPEIPPAREAGPATWQDYQKTYESLRTDSERHDIVQQYLMDSRYKNILNSAGFTPEKINTYAHMFDGDWKSISPEHMKATMEAFDKEVMSWTHRLVNGDLNEALSKQPETNSQFPIESKDGRIYFAEWKPNGKWILFQMNENGQVSNVSKPGSLFRSPSYEFGYKDIRKFLGYKSPDEIVARIQQHEVSSVVENAPTGQPATPAPETQINSNRVPGVVEQSSPKPNADTVAGEKIAARIENMNEQVSNMRTALQKELQEHPIDWNTETREHIGIKDPDSGNIFLIETRTGNTVDSLSRFRADLIRPPVSQNIQVESLKEEVIRLPDGRWRKIMYYGELK